MRRSVVTAAAAVLLFAAGCGGGDDAPKADSPEDAKALLEKAITETSEQESAKVLFSFSGDGAELITGEGAFSEKTSELNIDAAKLMELAAEEDPGTLPEGIDPSDIKTTIIVADEVLYAQIPAGLGDQFGVTTEWVKIDSGTLAEGAGVPADSLSKEERDKQLKELDKYIEKVDSDGSEEIGGTNTTKLAVTLDQEALAEAGADGAEEAGDTELNVYVDGDNLIRRVEFTVSGMDTEEEDFDELSMQLDLSDFGTEVEADVPADDDVTDLTEMLGALGSDAEMPEEDFGSEENFGGSEENFGTEEDFGNTEPAPVE